MAGVSDLPIAGASQLTKERGQSATAERAVRIVDFMSNNRAVLNEREIQRIIKVEDLPTVVVSIGGVARSGKSFLLNLLINYLTYLEKHDSASGWEISDNPVQGVNWAQGRKSVTLGIWMWSKPFVIRRLDGKKVAVLLMDTQGTGDHKRSDTKLDTLIMCISLQLSSFQLINIVNYLASTDLTSLQLCTDYADIDEDSPTREQSSYCHLFDSLIFVVRNCQDTKGVFGEEPELFQGIKEDSINEELSRAVEGIEKAFKHITAFTLPYPGEKIAEASEKQKVWTLQDIPKRFLDPVKELATVLFTSDRMATEELPTGSQILEKFKVLKLRLESTDLPEIGNPADALQETILYQAYCKATILYTGTIKEVQRNLLSHKSEADLRTTLASARDLALKVFYSEGRQHKYGHSIIWRKYEELFQANCEERQSVLIEKYNQDKEMADLKRHNHEVKKELEEQARRTREVKKDMEKQAQQSRELKNKMDAQELRSREVKEKMEEQALQSAKQLGKLESESKETMARLEESKKDSEKREQAHQVQLDKVTEQMKTAREEDRGFYERESERYKESIEQEKEVRSRAERMHDDRMSELSQTIEKLNEDSKQTKKTFDEANKDLASKNKEYGIKLDKVTELMKSASETFVAETEKTKKLTDEMKQTLVDKATLLEGKATTLEGKATTLEGKATKLQATATEQEKHIERLKADLKKERERKRCNIM